MGPGSKVRFGPKDCTAQEVTVKSPLVAHNIDRLRDLQVSKRPKVPTMILNNRSGRSTQKWSIWLKENQQKDGFRKAEYLKELILEAQAKIDDLLETFSRSQCLCCSAGD